MMVLSRKANDQNRTILVIYSNHPPTNFGIITKIASVSKVTIFFKVFPIRFNPYGHIYRTNHAARATS